MGVTIFFSENRLFLRKYQNFLYTTVIFRNKVLLVTISDIQLTINRNAVTFID